MRYENPLIVQSDKTLLLDVHAPRADECRMALIPFAELERSPEHLHTYRLTPLSLWNACSAGIEVQKIIDVLEDFSKYDVPQSVKVWVSTTATRFGKIVVRALEEKKSDEKYLVLKCATGSIYKEIQSYPSIAKHLIPCELENSFLIELTYRGTIKQELLKMGWPVKDEAPLKEGSPLESHLRSTTLD